MELQATVTEYNQFDLVSQIERAITDGFALKINGYPVVGQYGSAPRVRAYGNGTIGFDTPSQTKGKTRPIYVKVGESLTVLPR